MSKSLYFALYILVFLSVFNGGAALSSGPYIISDLGGSNEIASYGVAFYVLGNAVTQPLAGCLGMKFGSLKTLFVLCILFFIMTLLCSLTPTFFLFCLVRFLTGAVAGPFFSTSFALMDADLIDSEKPASFAMLAVISTVVPIIGGAYGGWIAYDFNWRWIFYSQLPFIAFALSLLYLNGAHGSVTPQKRPFDRTGYIFYLLFAIPTFTAITVGQELDWFRSPSICLLLFVGVVSFGFFVLWERNHEYPFLRLELLKIPAFALCIFSISFIYGSYHGMTILLTSWLHLEANYTPIWIGILLLHMLIAGAILYIATWKRFEQTNSFRVILLAVACFAVACFYSSTFNVEINFGRLALARSIMGIGIVFSFFPLFFLARHVLPKDHVGEGQTIFQVAHYLFGGLAYPIFTTMLLRRTVFYHERLGEQLTVNSELTAEFFTKVAPYSASIHESDQLLEKALRSQASSLALSDCYYFISWVMLGTFLTIAWFRRDQLFVWFKKTLTTLE